MAITNNCHFFMKGKSHTIHRGDNIEKENNNPFNQYWSINFPFLSESLF